MNPESFIRNLIKKARAEERKAYAAKMDKRLRAIGKKLEGLHMALMMLLAAESGAKTESATPKAPRKPRAKKEIDKAILDKVLEVLAGSSLNGEVATAKNIERASGISRSTTKKALNALITVGLVAADGKGRGRTYKCVVEEDTVQ